MGRWGYRDADLDIVSEFEDAVGVSLYDDAAKLEEARIKLDAGLGVELFRKYKAKEQDTGAFFDPKYTTILFGAYLMTVGAVIAPEDRQHLNDIFHEIPSRNGYALPIGDEGFRDPGQVQYKAALQKYVDGKPRSFFVPSCFNCGKISDDIAPDHLKRCVACKKDGKMATYCDKECQKQNWRKHKLICGRPRSNGAFQMLNV